MSLYRRLVLSRGFRARAGLAIIGLGLLAAAGCSPRPGNVSLKGYLEKRALAAAYSAQCMDEVKEDNPVYARLSELFIYDLNDGRQLSKITSRRLVTDQQIEDLILFREMIQPCYDRIMTDYGYADERYADYLLFVRHQSDKNLQDLLERKITIGERNIFLLETLVKNRRKFTEIDAEILAEIEAGISPRGRAVNAVGDPSGDPPGQK